MGSIKVLRLAVCLSLFGLLIKDINAELTPPYFNLATGRKIYATATCGVDTDGPELYCKLVGANTEHDAGHSVIQGQVCDYCDPNNKDKRHPPENAIDGTYAWWQSPPLSRGNKYNEVNLTIDFGQEFHVAYLYIRMGNSPRPGLWSLEKSKDYGKTWTPWQHFSDTESDCESYFGRDSTKPITRDDDVICTTEYSKIVPLEDGEIPVMLLNNRPSAANYFNSTALQEWTRATNVRIRLLRTKNLLGHLMSVARQDPTVTRRYFYSIKDISIGGRCMCNGHADTCDVLDPKSEVRILACRCQHRTCGIQCNECCPGFEQKKWRQNTNARPFKCEPCNCHGHSTSCVYDEEIDRKGLSLDIHDNYDGGGVCQNCLHNTEGINCNRCKPKFYRPYEKKWDDVDVCKACDCNYFYSTGNCEEGTGRCECNKEFQPPNCDSCAYGYYGYPNCRECDCNLNGTDGYHCEAVGGSCPCKINFSGKYCKQCSQGYYSYPECKACDCNQIGSINNDCDTESGQCKCLSNFGGHNCERCKHGYFSYPTCKYCDCDIQGTEDEICSKDNGQCICREGFGGPRCDQCLPGYYNYPDCKPCNCSTQGSTVKTCDVTGKCNCLANFAGKQCNSCSAGYYNYPECLNCNCDVHGSEGVSCNGDGQCSCLPNFDGKNCDVCKERFYNFPSCEECNCDPAGVIAKFAGCGSVPAGELCQCKERVTGRICNQCKPLFWNLNVSNPEGCEVCDCFLDGTIAMLDTCESKTGQCICKPYVGGRQCRECKDGTYDLFGGSLFGCKDCGCDIGGSRNPTCDKNSGQCGCHPRITGRTCTQPLTTHYFPTLHQFKYEYEDGATPSGAQVRYEFDESQFPGFSGKGYAVFSSLQTEFQNEIHIFKSSVYRMVIRYVNPSDENVTATILIQSDNPSEVDQTAKVLLKVTNEPLFVTVSGSKGDKPSPIVLDPGRYTISTKSDKNVKLDYFVLLPAAYYEAAILTRKIENPCELGSMDLCRHYKYPSVQDFRQVLEPYIADGDKVLKPSEFYTDHEHLTIVSHSGDIPVISDTQRNLKYLVDFPKTGRYIIVVDYITDKNYRDETYFVKIRIDDEDSEYGSATLYPCLYSMACRQPVLDEQSREKSFFIDVTDLKPVEVYQDQDEFGRVAIISVTAIPVEKYSIDYITPSPVCVISDGECSAPKFRSVPDSKKIEYETDHEEKISLEKPPYAAFDENVKLILLDQNNSTIEIRSKVSEPGRYVVLVKYYQPHHPRYNVFYSLEAGKQYYDGKFDVSHCPSSSGCRGLIGPDGVNSWFDIEDEFKFTITNNRPQGIWLDYLLLVPVDQFNVDLLVEETFDQTKEFIRQCGQDHFHIPLNASDFCKKAVFSLTADYNNGALQCSCNYDGSTSFECDPYGGQCQCKPDIIGRQCDACRTGFFGFPDCKPCDCPITALCEKYTGECICPPHVTGDKCDQCKPYTYGFHQIIGCEECNCEVMGVKNGNLQCDLYNGSCSCRPNIEGRACDQCSNGYSNFPHCDQCSCNTDGTVFKICDKNDGNCFCKPNVVGENCEFCVDGTYNLQEANPEGCTKCFCFGKTSRCESAYLRVFNVSLLSNVSINNVQIREKVIDFEQWAIPSEEIMLNETTIQADFSFKDGNDDGLVYFGVLDYLLNQHNHLTAYGGHLGYNLYYTTGPFGKGIFAPDVILYGKDNVLVHENYEQPSSAQVFSQTVEMIETNFKTHDGKPVSRADFMMVLRDLKAIYIRANYWEQTVISRLSDVYLTLADDDADSYSLYQELAVEKCHCPAGYTGLSCEDCAPGYYRDPNGPYGGYCIPCECNGHAETCDCNTGICRDCQHSTYGDHCELCVEGYYGNATYGTPHDCMICACPLPFDSNNFATGCEISETGREIHCECKPGYTGARCESCAPGFFGQPEVQGDFCKPCDCSGNINADEPGSCDTITGECLQCLNNTYGKACNLCAPGFYGDAIKAKDCKSCDCALHGTRECDHSKGSCICNDNVIGERCDRCKPDHYGYESGYGCKSCDCGVASNSTQCDDHTGDCACKPGVTGRQCDRCAVDHWNYTPEGCTPCLCNQGYSRGFGCNPSTGQCECLPGVIGEKCDACPHRWVLIKDEGCSECDECHHALLDVTDKLRKDIDPVVTDFKSVALAFFTTQKLNYFDEMADKVAPQVNALDPQGVNLSPARESVEKLEAEGKSLAKMISHSFENAHDSNLDAQVLLANATVILDESHDVSKNAREAILKVDNLAKSLETAASTKIDSALQEAEGILVQLNSTVIDLAPSTDDLDKASQLLYDIDLLTEPIKSQRIALDLLKNDIGLFSDKLEDLYNHSISSVGLAADVQTLNLQNKREFDNSKFNTVADQNKEAEKNLQETNNLLINGELTFNSIEKNLDNLRDVFDALKDVNGRVEDLLEANDKDHHSAAELVNEAAKKAEVLNQHANGLTNQYSYITADSEDAIKAATAYTDIFQAVGAAREAAREAKYAAGNATDLSDGIEDKAGKSDQVSGDLLQNARTLLTKVQSELEPRLNKSTENVNSISDLNQSSEAKLTEIYSALESLKDHHSTRSIWVDSDAMASDALTDSKKTLDVLGPIIKQVPKDLETAKNISKDIDTTSKDISQISTQINHIDNLVPNLNVLADEVEAKQNEFAKSEAEIVDSVERLKRQIEMAREIANSIQVGVRFQPSTVLELKAPESLSLLATKSKVSAFFNTNNPNSFLMYLGNDNKSASASPSKNADFLAMEVVNGFPVLTIDLGKGPERINSDKFVADGKWYQAIVDRVGNNVKLIIREEQEDGTAKEHKAEKQLVGSDNVFNVDKNSRLFVGGYPPDFVPPEDIQNSAFDGEIEELRIGDEEIGLWNFVDGQHNSYGAVSRDKLISQEVAPTGYRFNGNGYVSMDSKPYSFKLRSSIHFSFKASPDSDDGLLFYVGNKNRQFISVELRNGGIQFQYKLGPGHVVSMESSSTYNDDKWHRVEAERDGRKGLLKVDGKVIFQEEAAPEADETIRVIGDMFFGGHPRRINHTEVTNKHFDGCIDHVVVSGTNIDLQRHNEAYGVRPGCLEKISTSLAFKPHEYGFLKKGEVNANNNFHITFKFRTIQKDGILFYATDDDQTATIGLTIDDGFLTLRSMRSNSLASRKKYNDGEWHVVNAQHEDNRIGLSIDDDESYFTTETPARLDIINGHIYFGGLPKHYDAATDALASLAYFTGCISDVTLNGDVVNFASSVERLSGITDECPSDILDYDPTTVPHYFPGDREDSVETRFFVDPSEEEHDNEIVTTEPSTTTTTTTSTTTTTTAPTTTTTEEPTTTTTRKPKATKKPYIEEPEPICKLPVTPDFDVDFEEAGYRFLGSQDRRVEIHSLPVRLNKHYDVSLQFKTGNPNGLLFYGQDKRHINFIAVYLIDGIVYHQIHNGKIQASLSTAKEYNDDEWHTVQFSYQATKISLIIDDEALVDELEENRSSLNLEYPVYLGGVNNTQEEDVHANTKLVKGHHYHGCIRNPLFNGRPLEVAPTPFHVVPCSAQVEHGVFFGPEAEFVKVFDKFNVGTELSIHFDFKPRSQDGMVFSVHGRHSYMILELVNGTLIFGVKTDERNFIETNYTLSNGESFCDGKWRTVHVIKSKFVITLSVDSISSQPAVGTEGSSNTATSRPLFMGGHPSLQRKPGFKTRKPFRGCIRNLNVKSKPVRITKDMALGGIWLGVCPLN